MRRHVLALLALASSAALAHEGHERHFPSERLEPGVDKEAIINTSLAAVPNTSSTTSACSSAIRTTPSSPTS